MEPQQALAFLDQAVAQINATRQLHEQLKQAVGCLRVTISESNVVRETSAELDETED